jgi:DNA-binding transcriptional MerR regulator/effector-binding domain-containing protein
MSQGDLVPIGTFARATRLTVKALRHYHEVGVLVPARVDPSTRYRYYRWSQLPDALCVSMLRELDIPLERVRDHLREGVPLLEVLAGEHDRLRQRARRAEEALAVIDALQGRADTTPSPPEVVEWRERTTVVVTSRTRARSVHADAAALIAGLLGWAGQNGLDTAPPVVGDYPVSLDGTAAIAAHLPVVDVTAVPPHGSVGRLPAARVVRTVHTGPHASLAFGYAELLRWAADRGLSTEGRVYETYLDDPADVDAGRLRTELALPLTDHPDRGIGSAGPTAA